MARSARRRAATSCLLRSPDRQNPQCPVVIPVLPGAAAARFTRHHYASSRTLKAVLFRSAAPMIRAVHSIGMEYHLGSVVSLRPPPPGAIPIRSTSLRMNSRSNSPPDTLFAVWRDFWAMGNSSDCTKVTDASIQPALACSLDGGSTWSTVPIGLHSDFPRVSFDGTFVWVVYREGNDILVDKRICGGSPLAPTKGFPQKVATITPITCPITGLDRCSGNGLSAPTIASDGYRVAVTYATANASGGDDIAVVKSYGGGNWSSPQIVNENPTTARRFMPWSCSALAYPILQSRVWMGWYDRRAATAAGATPDLTDYYVTWLGRGATSPSGVMGPDMRMSVASDPQCRAPWTAAPDQGWPAVAACPAFPGVTGTCTGGACTAGGPVPPGCTCQNGTINCGCQIQAGAVTPAACVGVSICKGRGVPRYGDYNGLGCSPSLVAAAWAATVDVNGNPTPGNSISVNVRTIGINLREKLGTPYSSNFIQRKPSSASANPEFDLLFTQSRPSSVRLTHLVRRNDLPGFPWSEAPSLQLVVDESGRTERPLGASVIQSSLPAQPGGTLEAVVRMQRPASVTNPSAPRDQYLTFYAVPDGSNTWFGLGAIQVAGSDITGVTGDPALIQSTRGDKGNLEMLVPVGRDVAHYVRDNDLFTTPWNLAGYVFRGPGPFNAVPVDVALIQSTIRSPSTNGPSTNAGDIGGHSANARTGRDRVFGAVFFRTQGLGFGVTLVFSGRTASRYL